MRTEPRRDATTTSKPHKRTSPKKKKTASARHTLHDKHRSPTVHTQSSGKGEREEKIEGESAQNARQFTRPPVTCHASSSRDFRRVNKIVSQDIPGGDAPCPLVRGHRTMLKVAASTSQDAPPSSPIHRFSYFSPLTAPRAPPSRRRSIPPTKAPERFAARQRVTGWLRAGTLAERRKGAAAGARRPRATRPNWQPTARERARRLQRLRRLRSCQGARKAKKRTWARRRCCLDGFRSPP